MAPVSLLQRQLLKAVIITLLVTPALLKKVSLRGGGLPVDGLQVSSSSPGVAIVEPVAGSSKLAVNERGLDALRRMTGPLAPVVVIGPYRSGKSFFINQMLNRSCADGMVVGHTRSTQTKGIWLWNTPIPVPASAQASNNSEEPISLLFFDTEGFESTGKSDAYDDRIFALAAVLSSTLVYNLAEAVRESDIEKLSFAVELAQAFYSLDGKASAFVEPSSMVWLIQRDFLQGVSAQSMLQDALSPVKNPLGQADIAQVNRIRSSLSVLARDSVAVGLPQPHLDRTRLCEMTDAELVPAYITKREQVRSMIYKSARPKIMKGRAVGGKELAALIQDMVTALNSREIPTSVSLLDTFNQQLTSDCVAAHATALAAIGLPTSVEHLQQVHTEASDKAIATFRKDMFGIMTTELLDKLHSQISRSLREVEALNEVQSNRQCEALESECETGLEWLYKMPLPSLGRFDAKAKQCERRFTKGCVGPARARQEARLSHARTKERLRFQREYNDRLYTGIVVLSLVDIALARFVLKHTLLELAGWALLAFLQVYPRIAMGMGGMYQSAWWLRIVAVWEVIVYNPVLDLGTWWLPVLVGILVSTLACRVLMRRRKARHAKQLTDKGASRDLRV